MAELAILCVKDGYVHTLTAPSLVAALAVKMLRHMTTNGNDGEKAEKTNKKARQFKLQEITFELNEAERQSFTLLQEQLTN